MTQPIRILGTDTVVYFSAAGHDGTVRLAIAIAEASDLTNV